MKPFEAFVQPLFWLILKKSKTRREAYSIIFVCDMVLMMLANLVLQVIKVDSKR